MSSVAVMMPLPIQWDPLSEWIISKSLKRVKKQAYPKGALRYFFIVREDVYDKAFNFLTKFMQSNFTLIRWKGRDKEESRFPEIADARNILLEHGRHHPWGLFLDSDVVMPKHGIWRLIIHRKDVCGAVVKIPSNIDTIEYGFGKFSDDLRKGVEFSQERPFGLTEVDFVNTACMLLSKRIMNDNRVSFSMIRSGDMEASEDHSYCYLAKMHGYRVFVDPGIHCVHYRRFSEREVAILKVT